MKNDAKTQKPKKPVPKNAKCVTALSHLQTSTSKSKVSINH